MTNHALQPQDGRLEAAIGLMSAFARRTGIGSKRPPSRYLWTDAYAVCNFLGLARVGGDAACRDKALRLIDQVHSTLGRHRADNGRSGWLSRLDETAGREHPTQGGLRIGKPLPERTATQPFDALREWRRDGQYFHYLTRWMHALDQASRATGDARYNFWARELARTACRAFLRERPGMPSHLAWKMSIDLSRPQVEAAGLHDALDGFVTLTQLRATAAALPPARGSEAGPDLEHEIALLASLKPEDDWITGDLLGIGGLLADAERLARLLAEGAAVHPAWLSGVLKAALESLLGRAEFIELRRPVSERLAFRELGFAIGLRAIGPLRDQVLGLPPGLPHRDRILFLAEQVHPFSRFGVEIESCWRQAKHRETIAWREHRDINDVMLATCLQPEGFFTLPLPGRGAGEEARP